MSFVQIRVGVGDECAAMFAFVGAWLHIYWECLQSQDSLIPAYYWHNLLRAWFIKNSLSISFVQWFLGFLVESTADSNKFLSVYQQTTASSVRLCSYFLDVRTYTSNNISSKKRKKQRPLFSWTVQGAGPFIRSCHPSISCSCFILLGATDGLESVPALIGETAHPKPVAN